MSIIFNIICVHRKRTTFAWLGPMRTCSTHVYVSYIFTGVCIIRSVFFLCYDDGGGVIFIVALSSIHNVSA